MTPKAGKCSGQSGDTTTVAAGNADSPVPEPASLIVDSEVSAARGNVQNDSLKLASDRNLDLTDPDNGNGECIY